MARKAIPAPGTYQARRAGEMVVYETEKTGALCLAVPVQLLNSEVNWVGKTTLTLVKGDGEVKVRTVNDLKRIFPSWDGVDPFALMDLPLSEEGQPEFEVVGEHEPYTPEGETEAIDTFKVKWLNPLGGSTSMPEPPADRKALLAKYGSKFKALSGGSAKPAPAKAAKPAAAPAQQELGTKPAAPAPASKGPPSRGRGPAGVARTLTQDDVWDLLVAKNPNGDQDEMGTKFWAAADEVQEGGELTPAQWGEVATKLGV